MTWLTWRQHRAEVYALGLLVAVIGAFLLAVGLQMHSLFPGGAGQCLGADLSETCSTAIRRLNEEHGYASKMLNLFSLVPFLIGAFFGAPLVARELEAGTWQFALTQSVPRMRWLAVKLGALGLATALLTGVFSALITWYRQPIDVLDGRFGADAFDLEGLVPAGHGLFAFAAATAAGAVLRRSLPALAVALGAFLAVRVFVMGWLRPNYQEPHRLVELVAADDPADPGNPRMSTGSHLDWTISTGYVDSSGRPLSLYDSVMMYSAAEKQGVKFSAYLHERGVQQWIEYQPAERFWTFQLVETAIFTGLAAALLALVVWRFKRRVF
ncbi:ABC transporter permease subunit [Lentzea sp. BCCO 10_0856]|uniref:ABC transporter permease subunit n=1 Tax=Lentzea miocenica TaxID=3095431 RepID=A0ABU4T2S1_9PSEU|nr:ABC transporter permease subunit [Lentzea sp. BCCO 10_0856]MDX8032322.1 ABC transporter permease subunit [Lentzea sp. BCCO 10_0856]